MVKNQVVIIIGAGGVIGKAVVQGLIAANAKVICADINIQNLDKELNCEKVDINSPESVKKLISTVAEKYGSIDAVVNLSYPRNKNYGRSLFEVEYNDFNENVSIHLGGYFLVMQQFAAFMKKQGKGVIINFSSIYGVIAPRFEIYNDTGMTMPVEYAACKSAIIHLTKYFAKYLKGSSVRVNCISPGGISNQQDETFTKAYNTFAMSKGMLDRNDLNELILFLLSDGAKYINGQNIVIDDGWTL